MEIWDSIVSNSQFVYTHRVRYADTDRMGVVYHGRYFEWFEAARTESMRHAGLSYRDLEETGILLPVIDAQCRYRHSVFYDEIVHIETCVQTLTRAKLTLQYRLTVEGDIKLRAEARTVHCFMAPNGRGVRAAEPLLSILNQL